MKTLARFTTTAGTNRSVFRALSALAFSLALATSSQAVPITGDPVSPNPFGWTPNSTAALNYADLAPGREGQGAPYVIFNSSAVGSVILDFYNFGNAGVAFFETRIDGIQTGVTAHPVVIGDTIHAGTYLAKNTSVLGKTFLANSYVDIRLALGGERDYDFDWTRFYVTPAGSVPDAGTTFGLLGFAVVGLGMLRRKLNS